MWCSKSVFHLFALARQEPTRLLTKYDWCQERSNTKARKYRSLREVKRPFGRKKIATAIGRILVNFVCQGAHYFDCYLTTWTMYACTYSFLRSAKYIHQYIRSRDTSTVYVSIHVHCLCDTSCMACVRISRDGRMTYPWRPIKRWSCSPAHDLPMVTLI